MIGLNLVLCACGVYTISLIQLPTIMHIRCLGILESLVGCKYIATYYTTLDLTSGFWHLELTESGKEKTAFSTSQGHYNYEFNVMSFGLINTPATFQRLMECALAGLKMNSALFTLMTSLFQLLFCRTFITASKCLYGITSSTLIQLKLAVEVHLCQYQSSLPDMLCLLLELSQIYTR